MQPFAPQCTMASAMRLAFAWVVSLSLGCSSGSAPAASAPARRSAQPNAQSGQTATVNSPPPHGLTLHWRGVPLNEARQVVVLMHGFGAPGTDLIGLEAAFGRAGSIAFLFPEAPIDLGRGRAWWQLGDWRARREAGVDLSQEEPPGMAAAAEKIAALLREVEQTVPASRIFIGGFSQGAMLALDVALRSEQSYAGVMVLSGTLVAASRWQREAERHRRVPVLVTHGSRDTMLPIEGGRRLRVLLERAGMRVRWVEFDGPHTIDPLARRAMADFVR